MSFETASSPFPLAVTIVKSLILILGGVITYLAFKAFRRTNERSLGIMAAGFGMITLGAFLAGVTNQLLGISLAGGVLVEGVFVLLGFSLIAYSLYI